MNTLTKVVRALLKINFNALKCHHFFGVKFPRTHKYNKILVSWNTITTRNFKVHVYTVLIKQHNTLLNVIKIYLNYIYCLENKEEMENKSSYQYQ